MRGSVHTLQHLLLAFILSHLPIFNSFSVSSMFFSPPTPPSPPAAGAEIAATYLSSSVRLHLNLPAQACVKLLTNDPHKAVSVAEAAIKRILQPATFPF